MPDLRTCISNLAALAALGLPAMAGAVPIDVDGPTTGWLAVGYPTPAPDVSDDQQGNGFNVEADIVGNSANPAFYTAFDDAGTGALTDGMLGFRVRLGTDAGAAGFSRVAAVGIDANFDAALDLFVLVDKSGSGNPIRILNPGTGANNSPSTTTISGTGLSYAESPSTYAWNPVDIVIDPSATSFDVDADGQTDYFVSFAVSFQDVVTRLAALGIPNVDQNTQFRYVVATSSTTVGALNRDIGGPPNSGLASTLVWDDPFLGAMSNPYAAGAGAPVPEPGTGLMLGLGLLALARARRRG